MLFLLVHPPMGSRSTPRLWAAGHRATEQLRLPTGAQGSWVPAPRAAFGRSRGTTDAPALQPSTAGARGGESAASTAPGLQHAPSRSALVRDPAGTRKEGKIPSVLTAQGPGRRIPAEGPAWLEGERLSSPAEPAQHAAIRGSLAKAEVMQRAERSSWFL